MVPTITHWQAAAALEAEIRPLCVAFARGDQPEKIAHLTFEQIKELRDSAVAIVTFGAAALRKRHPEKVRDAEAYSHARQYARNLTHILLHRQELDHNIDYMAELIHYLDSEPDLPSIQYRYV